MRVEAEGFTKLSDRSIRNKVVGVHPRKTAAVASRSLCSSVNLTLSVAVSLC